MYLCKDGDFVKSAVEVHVELNLRDEKMGGQRWHHGLGLHEIRTSTVAEARRCPRKAPFREPACEDDHRRVKKKPTFGILATISASVSA